MSEIQETTFVICRICEQKIDAELIHAHLVTCQQAFEQKKLLNQLDLENQKLSELVQKQRRTLFTQLSLQKIRLQRVLTPERAMKSSAPIKSLVLDNNDESEEDNKSLKSQKSLRQVKEEKAQVKSRFAQYQNQNADSGSVTSSEESDCQKEIVIVKENANEDELADICKQQIQNLVPPSSSGRTPQPILNFKQISSPLSGVSGSPRSGDTDLLEKLSDLKSQINQLDIIIKYTDQVIKNQGQYSIQNDLEAQIELFKIKLSSNPTSQIIKQALGLIEKRVQCIQKLVRLTKEEKDPSQVNVDGNTSNSQNRNSMKSSKEPSNTKRISNTFNVIDFLNKKQVEKELSQQPRWISRPNTISQFDQMTPTEILQSPSNTEGKGSNAPFFNRCVSDSESDVSMKENSLLIEDEHSDRKAEPRFGCQNSHQEAFIQNESNIIQALENEEVQKNKAYYSDSENKPQKLYQVRKLLNVRLQDFEFLEVLGVGAFGAVWLVSKKKTNDYYAMKVIDCRNKNLEEIQALRAEKNVFEILQGDFVVKAYYSFLQDNCLFFLLEYMKGGDFDQVLTYYGRLDEAVARFYLAELLLAIESLHKNGIIHRDLKPQNILLNANGHIKLADFGLSEIALQKKVKQELLINTSIENMPYHLHHEVLPSYVSKRKILTKTNIEFQTNSIFADQQHHSNSGRRMHKIVGTPDYIAPEAIKGQGESTFSLDVWSFGVIAYEFLVGVPPFNDQTIEAVFENILRNCPEWPEIGDEEDQISLRAYELITRCLENVPNKRITISEIKQHKFFEGVDWSNIRNQEAPIIPIRDLEPVEEPTKNGKKEKAQAKMKHLLQTVEQSQDGRDELSQQLKQIANFTRIDLLAKLSQKDAEDAIKRRQSFRVDHQK